MKTWQLWLLPSCLLPIKLLSSWLQIWIRGRRRHIVCLLVCTLVPAQESQNVVNGFLPCLKYTLNKQFAGLQQICLGLENNRIPSMMHTEFCLQNQSYFPSMQCTTRWLINWIILPKISVFTRKGSVCISEKQQQANTTYKCVTHLQKAHRGGRQMTFSYPCFDQQV